MSVLCANMFYSRWTSSSRKLASRSHTRQKSRCVSFCARCVFEKRHFVAASDSAFSPKRDFACVSKLVQFALQVYSGMSRWIPNFIVCVRNKIYTRTSLKTRNSVSMGFECCPYFIFSLHLADFACKTSREKTSKLTQLLVNSEKNMLAFSHANFACFRWVNRARRRCSTSLTVPMSITESH